MLYSWIKLHELPFKCELLHGLGDEELLLDDAQPHPERDLSGRAHVGGEAVDAGGHGVEGGDQVGLGAVAEVGHECPRADLEEKSFQSKNEQRKKLFVSISPADK